MEKKKLDMIVNNALCILSSHIFLEDGEEKGEMLK
jgi:hypothetical protein